jgi:hypothetical protein
MAWGMADVIDRRTGIKDWNKRTMWEPLGWPVEEGLSQRGE